MHTQTPESVLKLTFAKLLWGGGGGGEVIKKNSLETAHTKRFGKEKHVKKT